MLNSGGKRKAKNYIFASLLTGVYDVNRKEHLGENDFRIIQKWYDSIVKLQINAIVFHNSFSKETVEKNTNSYIQFVEVDYDQRLNPNIYRYFVYQSFLKQTSLEINHLFVTDISDVEVLNNPFDSNFYLENSDSLFCGDEPKLLGNDWMRNHCNHLRNLIPEFGVFEELNQQQTLLNCGIIGSNISAMKKLFDRMVALHEAYSFTNETEYTLDMGVFNYVVRNTFANKIIHGEPINTVFKKFEIERTDCWFRHK